MAGIEWIKIVTAMFDDEKIKIIESLPESDSILIIWIKLLCLAGKINELGYIVLNGDMPFTIEMLAPVMGRPLNTVRFAIETFQKMGMVQDQNGYLYIKNWEKYQNIEGMERIKEQTRLRVQAYRDRQRPALTAGNSSQPQRLPDKASIIIRAARRLGYDEKHIPSREELEHQLNNLNHLNPLAKSRMEMLLEEYKRLELEDVTLQ